MGTFIDLTGEAFGRLSVLRLGEPNKRGDKRWICICDCGREVLVAGNHLRSGAISSCGCYRKDVKTTHGRHGSKEYIAWGNMLARCNNPEHPSYPNYGGRGITVDPAWLDFKVFYADMGDCPEGLTLDRVDNELGYSAANCAWRSATEQALNKRARQNASGHTGVYWNKARNKWTVQLYRSGRSMHVGDFLTIELAIEARDKAVKEWTTHHNSQTV